MNPGSVPPSLALLLVLFGGLLLLALFLDDIASQIRLPGILLVLVLGPDVLEEVSTAVVSMLVVVSSRLVVPGSVVTGGNVVTPVVVLSSSVTQSPMHSAVPTQPAGHSKQTATIARRSGALIRAHSLPQGSATFTSLELPNRAWNAVAARFASSVRAALQRVRT